MAEPALRGRMLYLVGGPGNAERVDVSDLFASRLASLGLQIDYVIFDRHPSPAWRKTIWRGATAYVVGRSRRTGLTGAVINKLYEFAADLRTFWISLKGSYDIIQIRDKFVVGVLCVFSAKLRRSRFVYWLSYPYAEGRVLDAKEGRALVPWLSLVGGKVAGWLLYRVIMPQADHNFVQSEQMLLEVAAKGIPVESMSAVPMAVSDELLLKPIARVEADTILYLGTLLRVRRLEVLIEALGIVKQTHPAARLIFVGDGETPQDRLFLEQVTEKLGLSDAVEFTGMLPMSKAHDRAAAAAVCVSPFFPTPVLRTTSPTKLSEYMALGRPVVVNSHPEQSLVIEASGAGFCVDWSAAEFADAISRLLSDPEAADRMGALGREYVRAHRTYPVIARQVAERYRKLLPPDVHAS
ncbi:MAG: glycosyltransferase [Gammaproteobacteria bacterium]|nr:glycosyltransferase [Gammaproteobacteria bacterium]